MMTKRSGWLVGLGVVLAGLAGLGLYRAGRAASPTAVAIVNVQKLMNDSAEAVTRRNEYDAYRAPYLKEINDLETDAKDKEKRLEMLPPRSKDWLDLAIELQKVRAKIKANTELYNSVLGLKSAEMFRTLYESVGQAVNRVAQQDGWQAVLLDDRDIELKPDLTPSQVATVIKDKRVLYAENSVDITARVLTEMDNVFNAPAPKNGAGK